MTLKFYFITSFLATVLAQDQNACDLNCFFSEKIINLQTIKIWPKSCETVCGDIIINAETDVTSARLGQIFHKLEYLRGNMKIENSKYTSLNFFSQLRQFDCVSGEALVVNNSELKDINAIGGLYANDKCVWTIANNSKLDVDKFYHSGGNGKDFNVYGNLKDIECNNVRITPESLPYYQNCTDITGDGLGVLKITKVDQSTDLSGFLNLKTVTGNLEIYDTDLQNLSFLANMQAHIGERFQAYNVTNIHDNPKLTRLGWDSLKHLGQDGFGYTINIENNHPDFCITTKELQVFAEFSVSFYAMEASLCPELTRKDGQKVCSLEGLSTLDTDCQHIIGEVVIDSENEMHASKLGSVTNIYGSLTVRDTKELVDVSFLAKLRQIATMKVGGYPLLRIMDNKKIEKVALPKMKTPPFPPSDDYFIQISGNSLEIFKNRRECMLFQKQTQTTVKYNGKSCMKLPAADGSTGGDVEEWEEGL